MRFQKAAVCTVVGAHITLHSALPFLPRFYLILILECVGFDGYIQDFNDRAEQGVLCMSHYLPISYCR